MLGKAGWKVGQLPAGIAEVTRRCLGVLLERCLTSLGEIIGPRERLDGELGLHGLLAFGQELLANRLGIGRSGLRLSVSPRRQQDNDEAKKGGSAKHNRHVFDPQ